MQIISGKYKGKKLDGFKIDGTRPTMGRVKESLFAMDFITSTIMPNSGTGITTIAMILIN